MTIVLKEMENGLKVFESSEIFYLMGQAVLSPLVLCFETYGMLSKNRDNAILVHHALSVGSHVNSHVLNREPGWWENMIGPDRAIDTNYYFVICINNLGSCFGSSGPASIDVNTKQPYLNFFPRVDISDMVKSQKVLLDYLGIKKLVAVIGGSMGGMLSLTWSILYPDTIEKLILIATALKAYLGNIAYRSIQRDIINLFLKIKDASGMDNMVNQGFSISRKYALLNYRNQNNIEKFFKSQGDLNYYLEKNAIEFVKKFNVYSYLYLLDALDSFNVSNYGKNLSSVLKKIKSDVLLISINSDSLYPPIQQEELYSEIKLAGGRIHYIQHESYYGHDAFLIDIMQFGGYFSNFISKSHVISI